MCDLFLGVVVGELIYQLIDEYHLDREVKEEQREEKESSKFLIAQPIKMPVRISFYSYVAVQISLCLWPFMHHHN